MKMYFLAIMFFIGSVCFPNFVNCGMTLRDANKYLEILLLRNLNQTQNGSVVVDFAPFDFIYGDQSVLFIDDTFLNQGIGRRKFDNISDTETIARYIYGASSIQYDWRNRNIYWLQSNTIEVADINGTYRTVLYWTNMEQINYMVIDPSKGYIFWSDGGAVAKIERASMHGDDTSRVVLVTTDIEQPFGLAMDQIHNHLYWSDKLLRLIERCSYTGDGRQILVHTDIGIPGHLDFFNGTLFWVNQLNQTLNALSVSLIVTEEVGQLPAELLQRARKTYKKDRLMNLNIRIFAENVIGKDDASPGETKCDQLSLTQEESSEIICKCSAYYNMTMDGKCIAEDKEEWEIIFSSNAYGISKYTNGSTEELSNIVVERMAFLDTENFVFSRGHEIYTTSLKNISAYKSSVFIPFKILAHDLEYDWLGDNLYCAANAHVFGSIIIMKISSDNTGYMNIYNYFPNSMVFDIALDVPKRLVFAGVDTRLYRVAHNDYTPLMEYRSKYMVYISLDTVEEIVYVSVYVIDPPRFSSIIHRCTYGGDILENRYQQYTTNTVIFYNFIFTYEIEDFRYHYFIQCDKRFHGNCRTVFKHEKLLDLFKIFRILPENRKYQGIHPCQENNGNCSHFCIPTYTEPLNICGCPHNLGLAPDKKNCITYPCDSISNGNCSMTCIPLEGFNYRCECSDGFKLASDGRICHGNMGLAFIQTHLTGWSQTDLSSNPHVQTYSFIGIPPIRIDYDPIQKEIYIVANEDRISKYNLDGSGEMMVVSSNCSIDDFAVDWLTRHVYWMSYTYFGRRELLNTSNTLRLPFTDLFSSTLPDIEESIRTNTHRILEFEVDVFNGHLFCVLAYVTDRDSTAYDMYYFEDNIFLSGTVRYKPVHAFRFEKFFVDAYLSVDTLHSQLYYNVLKSLDEQSMEMYAQYTDGTGLKQIASGQLLSRPVVFGDGYLHFVEMKSYGTFAIKTMKIENFQTVSSSVSKYGTNFVTGANLHITDTSENVDECREYQLCWSNVNAWTCLEAQRICDGVNDCYDSHDEHYCSLCSNDCIVVSFEMSCYQNDFINSDLINKTELFEFIKWRSSPVSKLVKPENLLSFDCSIKLEMKSSKSRYVQNVEITSMYRLHKLRQAFLSPLLSDLSFVSHVELAGTPLLMDVRSNGVGVFESALSLRIENSHLFHLQKGTFQNISKLKSLELTENGLLRRIDVGCFSGLKELESLSITGSFLPIISGSLLDDLGNLTFLNLSYNYIQILGEGIFKNLGQLLILDTRGNDIKLTSELFLETYMLQIIYCDSFTICCIKPPSVSDKNCTADKDDISSCTNLIDNRVLAAFLWLFGILAFCGNLAVVIYRGFVDKSIFTKSYFIFIYNLGLSDLIMSMYMLLIASHDAIYDGVYVWNDYTWKRNILCRIAGVLSMLSNEASMMFVTLITLERFLLVKYAFGTVKISRKHAVIISVAVWILASIISVIPLIFYPEFYSRSGVCIGIPLTQKNETGLPYSIFVFLGINFLLCAVIPFGQYYILDEVKKSGEKVQSTQTGRNAAVAKRLAVVVITDCLCWLPIGILVILSLAGQKTPRDVYAWVIIFVLPINAAVNPYLYTITDVKWDKDRRKHRSTTHFQKTE